MILGFNPLPCSCGGGVPSASEYGPGTDRPLGLTLEQMIDFYWNVREFTGTAVASWGGIECIKCGMSASGSAATAEATFIRDGYDGKYYQFDVLCDQGGAFNWSPTMEVDYISAEWAGTATLTVSVNLCDVKYADGLYYPYMVASFLGSIGRVSDSSSSSSSSSSSDDSYYYSGDSSSSSPGTFSCPDVSVASNWLSHLDNEPPNVGEWSVGSYGSVPLYIIYEEPDVPEEDQCDPVSPTSVTINWSDTGSFTSGTPA